MKPKPPTFHINTNLQPLATLTLVMHLRRAESRVRPSRQRDFVVNVLRHELECRAALRATEFGVASIHGAST